MTTELKAEAARMMHMLGGGDLMGRVKTLRPAQRKGLATFVVKHGLLPSAQALYVGIDELETCLAEAGYSQCLLCENYFETTPNGYCAACAEEVG